MRFVFVFGVLFWHWRGVETSFCSLRGSTAGIGSVCVPFISWCQRHDVCANSNKMRFPFPKEKQNLCLGKRISPFLLGSFSARARHYKIQGTAKKLSLSQLSLMCHHKRSGRCEVTLYPPCKGRSRCYRAKSSFFFCGSLLQPPPAIRRFIEQNRNRQTDRQFGRRDVRERRKGEFSPMCT